MQVEMIMIIINNKTIIIMINKTKIKKLINQIKEIKMHKITNKIISMITKTIINMERMTNIIKKMIIENNIVNCMRTKIITGD